jgi:hypothetical protein
VELVVVLVAPVRLVLLPFRVVLVALLLVTTTQETVAVVVLKQLLETLVRLLLPIRKQRQQNWLQFHQVLPILFLQMLYPEVIVTHFLQVLDW